MESLRYRHQKNWNYNISIVYQKEVELGCTLHLRKVEDICIRMQDMLDKDIIFVALGQYLMVIECRFLRVVINTSCKIC